MTIYPSVALGTLPSSQLLSSVALVAGSQAAPSYSIPLPSVTAPAPAPTHVHLPQVGSTSNRSGLILSPAAEPFPHKLVDKVKSGQFVEMRELLADNIALVQQLENIQGFPLQGPRDLACVMSHLSPLGATVSWGTWQFSPPTQQPETS